MRRTPGAIFDGGWIGNVLPGPEASHLKGILILPWRTPLPAFTLLRLVSERFTAGSLGPDSPSRSLQRPSAARP